MDIPFRERIPSSALKVSHTLPYNLIHLKNLRLKVMF